MSPTHTRKKGRLYRYYISTGVIRSGARACPIGRIPAATVEGIVIDQVRALIQTPEIIVATHRAARKASLTITEADVRTALVSFHDLWDELFPAEQARIVNLLVDRIDVRTDGLEVHLKISGLTSLLAELRSDAMGIAA